MKRKMQLPKQPDLELTLGPEGDEHVFRLVRIDYTVEEALIEHGEAIDRVRAKEGAGPLEVCEAVAEQLDTLLVQADSKRKAPSEVIMAQVKAKEMTTAEVRALIDQLMAEARPT